jgi:hypothetical protein
VTVASDTFEVSLYSRDHSCIEGFLISLQQLAEPQCPIDISHACPLGHNYPAKLMTFTGMVNVVGLSCYRLSITGKDSPNYWDVFIPNTLLELQYKVDFLLQRSNCTGSFNFINKSKSIHLLD